MLFSRKFLRSQKTLNKSVVASRNFGSSSSNNNAFHPRTSHAKEEEIREEFKGMLNEFENLMNKTMPLIR